MRQRISVAAIAAFVTLAGAARADVATGVFTLEDGVAAPSAGTVTLTLAADGTILGDISAVSYEGVGFDSPGVASLDESGFSPAPVLFTTGWFSAFYGSYESGFACGKVGTLCASHITWTIGSPGDFTSVTDVLGGGNASHPFFLETYDTATGLEHEWAADAVITAGSAAPEPTAWALMILGLGGLGAILRRRRPAVRT